MTALNEADQELAELASQLHQTTDAIDPAVRVAKGNRFIRWVTGSSIKLNFILATALVFSTAVNCVALWFAVHPQREYFASDNGRLFPMIPLSRPYRKPADVIQYAKDTVNRSFSMDFLNWRQELEDVRPRYTQDGFKSFLAALQAAGVLDTVRERRMNMSITSGTGVLTKEGVENGVYVWYIELPIEVKLAGQNSELPLQRFLATIRIDRVPTLDSIEGIGTGQLVTKPL